MSWRDYVNKTKDNPPRPLLVSAMDLVLHKDNALDLGAGALIDSKYLLDQGFKHVIALDAENIAQDIFNTLSQDRLEYKISTFDNYEFPENTFDLINAQYALPFNPKATFNQMFEKLKKSLKKDGVFTGQFFGEKDSWNTSDTRLTFHTCKEAWKLLEGLEVLVFNEEEQDERPAIGDLKHWHVFHVIAKKS